MKDCFQLLPNTGPGTATVEHLDAYEMNGIYSGCDDPPTDYIVAGEIGVNIGNQVYGSYPRTYDICENAIQSGEIHIACEVYYPTLDPREPRNRLRIVYDVSTILGVVPNTDTLTDPYRGWITDTLEFEWPYDLFLGWDANSVNQIPGVYWTKDGADGTTYPRDRTELFMHVTFHDDS